MKHYLDKFQKLPLASRLSLLVAALLFFTIGITINSVLTKQGVKSRANINTSGSLPASSTPDKYAANSMRTYSEAVKQGEIKPAGKILEASLICDVNNNPVLRINTLTQKNGYVPSLSKNPYPYIAELVDNDNHVLYQQYFTVPKRINYEKTDRNGTLEGRIIDLSYIPLVLTLPWMDNATRLVIMNKDRKEITSSFLSNIQVVNNKPDFRRIRGDEFLYSQNKSYAQSTKKALNVVLIGDRYTDMNQFHNDVDTILKGFLQVEPFKTRASQFVFNSVDNADSLGCLQYPPSIPSCDASLVTQRVNSAGVMYDYIIVINKGGGGGYAQTPSIAITDNDSYMGGRFTHEFGGHLIGKLADEYITIDGQGPLDNQLHSISWEPSNFFPPGDGNCYAGTPPAAAWQSLLPPIALNAYKAGCTYSNWYASSQSSLMYDLSMPFNRVSEAIINRRLDELVGSFTPTPQLSSVPTTTPTSALLSPTPSTINKPTPTLILLNPTNTPAPTSVSTIIKLDLLLHGVGSAGDNPNPNSSLSNKNPLHPQRNFDVIIIDSNNQIVKTASAPIVYNSGAGNFTGIIDLGPSFPTGNYNIKIKSDRYLRKLTPGIVSIETMKENNIPQTALVAGDIKGDNVLNILDYNILLDCGYGAIDPLPLDDPNAVYSMKNCKSHEPYRTNVDLDDNGIINSADYNLFLRELSVQSGD